MGHVILDSEIPDAHPWKRPIEDLIRETVGAVPGAWKVTVLVLDTAGWLAFVEREQDGYRRTLLLDRNEQTPSRFAIALDEALSDVDHLGH